LSDARTLLKVFFNSLPALVQAKVGMLQVRACETHREPEYIHGYSMKFFLYADNLHPTQLKRRAPEHQFQMLATLPDHTIQFCRWSSQWRCGLASVVPSPGEKVWGAIFEVTDEDVKLLDQFEDDVPQEAFRHVQVTVLNETGEKILVTTHAAAPIGKFKPKDHYLDWVIKGLKHWKFPEECIEQWQAYRPH